ncbi:MAG TPA: histidine--tRNA ligase, partial [Candidatus Onthomorpha intestinigallinarum]|nr:histidine--tRNA ligase [Candidatus Onthomorpha intestinigallinarum]
DCLEQLNLFPSCLESSTDVMFVNFGDAEALAAQMQAKKLREKNFKVEVYPEAAKIKKQMGYADNKKIRYVALMGENEIKEGKVTLKNMLTGEQSTVNVEEMERHIF